MRGTADCRPTSWCRSPRSSWRSRRSSSDRKTATIRVRAGISYALTEAMDEGHCGLPTDELVPLAEKLLEVPPELVRSEDRDDTGTGGNFLCTDRGDG